MSLSRIRTLAKKVIDPSLVGTGNLAANLIGGLLWLTLASLMTTEDYGQVNFYIAIASVASGVSLLGLNTTIMTFIPKGNERILQQANGLALILGSAAAIAVGILTGNIATAFLLLALSAFAMTIGEALGRKQYRRYTVLMIACRGSQFVLALTLYQVMGINGVILGYAVPAIIFGFRLFTTQRLSFAFTEIRSRSGFVTHSYSLSLSQSAIAYADKLLIGPIFGFAVLGVYQLGFQFLLFLSVIPSSLLQYLIPQEAAGNNRKPIKKFGLILAIVVAVAAFFAIPFIINGFFPKYVEAIPIAQIMVFGIIPLTTNALQNSKLLGSENSKPVLLGSLVYIAALVVLITILGSFYGGIGLAAATVASLSIQSFTLWIVSKSTGILRTK